MAEQANVRSIDSIAVFRAALINYIESIRATTSEAKSHVLRVQHWVSQTQKLEWTRRKKKCNEQLANARSDLERAKIARPDAHPSMFSDQIRGVERAKQALVHSENKLVAIARWSRELEREGMLFQGRLQRLSRVVDGDLERCTAWMAALIEHLNAYLKTPPPKLPKAEAAELNQPSTRRGGSEPARPTKGDDDNEPDFESSQTPTADEGPDDQVGSND